MVREIRTAEQFSDLIKAGVGYLYNDFGGRNPKLCPIHSMRCRWIPSMLRPTTGKLGVPKLWSADLDELIADIVMRGKVYAFCGSEPELGRVAGTDRLAPPAAPRPAQPARPATRPTYSIEDEPAIGEFGVTVDEHAVTVSSPYRLQFDSKPRTKVLKAAIGDAVSKLIAAPGQILEAVYTAASREPVDAENVLLYNVGAGRFAASALHGLRFERVYAEPPVGGATTHHHRYSIVSHDAPSTHWRYGRVVVRADGLRLPRLDAMSKPDGVWMAVRDGATGAAVAHHGHYALDITLEVGQDDAVRPADIVKPLVDGLVAGLHSHDGRDIDAIAPILASRLGISAKLSAAMLGDESRAWLGKRRLLWLRKDGIQWNPDDENCVSATFNLRRSQVHEWRVRFSVYEVDSLD